MKNESPPPPNASLPVIACELSALTADQRRRRQSLAEALKAGVLEVTDLPSGYAFHLDRRPTTLQDVEELITLEKLCCSFLEFASRIDGDSDRLVLEISGGRGVKPFIAAQFGIGDRLVPREDP